MRNQNFGIEIELTGLTRMKAAEVVAEYFGTDSRYDGGGYSAYSVQDTQGRKWKFVSDASIDIESKRNQPAEAVELVSPICVTISRPYRKSCGSYARLEPSPTKAVESMCILMPLPTTRRS